MRVPNVTADTPTLNSCIIWKISPIRSRSRTETHASNKVLNKTSTNRALESMPWAAVVPEVFKASAPTERIRETARSISATVHPATCIPFTRVEQVYLSGSKPNSINLSNNSQGRCKEALSIEPASVSGRLSLPLLLDMTCMARTAQSIIVLKVMRLGSGPSISIRLSMTSAFAILACCVNPFRTILQDTTSPTVCHRSKSFSAGST
mmetsp:Transcript_25562/g.40965  ORF Transcript_25562/g.40965 Transcript_25562/m.40965 type:complete len:207 (-) Transcript_25562:1027-1647(-)